MRRENPMSDPKKGASDICPASKFAREQQSHFLTAMDRGSLGALVKQGEEELKANGCKPLPQSNILRKPTSMLGGVRG
jgi:hypothetical protein